MQKEAIIKDMKVFIPSKDFLTSLRFYQALGWVCNWRSEGLAELEIANQRFYLQDFYVKEWAENCMIYLNVADAQYWCDRVLALIETKQYSGIRVATPEIQPHGDKVTYVWDPAGILLHFAEPA